MKELNKIEVIDLNIHEIKNEIMRDFVGDFDLIGNLKIGNQNRQTHIGFRNINDYESYINSNDEGYDAKDAVFIGYIYKLNSPQIKKVNRSQNGNGCHFKQQIIEYRRKNC